MTIAYLRTMLGGSFKLTPAACRAGRALLGWSQGDLVRAASVSPNTVAKVEAGEAVRDSTAARLVAAFDAAGAELLNGDRPGARLKARASD